ncbi:ABC transporter permease [Carboxylicivirga sp. M1479]|uniref:ABC transporter permease n=1 Tax=Carboxylicivirga sp. M1479 TaxID=2594476 RepID=UPI0011773674|nr:ABC transporter permease [Carboxylicivirga sp. M1479]TRX72661.1 FtsX-like permease family protein [Carboxylicivirga sp. M1479]
MDFLKIILPQFYTSKRISLFNFIGLSVSFAVLIILALYLYHEFTFDRYNENCNQLYLIEAKRPGEDKKSPNLPNPLGALVEEEVPGVDKHCTLKSWGGIYVRKDKQTVNHNLSLFSVDSTFCDLFTLKIKQGNAISLKGKRSIILSETAAKRIFGDKNPIGEVLLESYKLPLTVEAVYEDFPANHSFYKIDGFCSFIEADWVNKWSEWSFYNFFAIDKKADISSVEKKINELEQIKERSFDDDGNMRYSFHLTQLSDVHFESVLGSGNKKIVLVLMAISIMLLLMAFVNYLNFSLASLPREVKGVCLRKVNGASGKIIFWNRIQDSIKITSISFLLGIVISSSALKINPEVYDYQLSLGDSWLLIFVLYLLLVIIAGVLSTIPTSIMLKLNPSMVLKGLIPISVKKGAKRNVLPIIQYVFAIVLIVGVILINKQINFIKHYDLGFEKENVVVVNTTRQIRKQEKAFALEVLKNPNVLDYAFSQFVPGGVGMGWGREIDGKYVNYKAWPIDERYLDFMGFEMAEGRPFSKNLKADENNFIFNETAVRQFGWDNTIGKKVPGFNFKGEVVGVVKDMKYASLYEDVEPMCFWLTSERHNQLSLRITGDDVSNTIDYINNVYKNFESKYPFDYFFLNNKLNKQYVRAEKQAKLIFLACVVALIIAVIGTLGMASFICEYRIKEIGVRKANGASATEVVKMINRSFFIQILIAIILSSPIAYWTAESWLNIFAYKTELSWWIFGLAGSIALIMVLFTVSWQSWMAARRNPVEALRYE